MVLILCKLFFQDYHFYFIIFAHENGSNRTIISDIV